MNRDYLQTLDTCEELKDKLNELSGLLKFTVSQGRSILYSEKKQDLINWIEEIEFEINNQE